MDKVYVTCDLYLTRNTSRKIVGWNAEKGTVALFVAHTKCGQMVLTFNKEGYVSCTQSDSTEKEELCTTHADTVADTLSIP